MTRVEDERQRCLICRMPLTRWHPETREACEVAPGKWGTARVHLGCAMRWRNGCSPPPTLDLLHPPKPRLE